MLNEKQLMAIGLLIDGKLNKVEIAKSCGKSRQWLYDQVINNVDSKAETDKQLQVIQTNGINIIKSNLQKSIDNIIALANNSDSEKIRADCNFYLIDRVLGKVTTKIEVTDTDKDITGDFNLDSMLDDVPYGDVIEIEDAKDITK